MVRPTPQLLSHFLLRVITTTILTTRNTTIFLLFTQRGLTYSLHTYVVLTRGLIIAYIYTASVNKLSIVMSHAINTGPPKILGKQLSMGEMVPDDVDAIDGGSDAIAGRHGGGGSGGSGRDRDKDRDRDVNHGDRRGSSNSSTTVTRTNSRDGGGSSSGRTPLSSVALALMDVLYTNLTVLQYPLRGSTSNSTTTTGTGNGMNGDGKTTEGGHILPPLLPMHFAGDLNGMGVIAGRIYGNQGGGGQFRTMVDVAMWLCRVIGGQVAFLYPFLSLCPRLSLFIVISQLLAGYPSSPLPPLPVA